MMYYEYYFMAIILLPAIIFAFIAQAKIDSSFKKYKNVKTQNGISAHEVAEKILSKKNVIAVTITKINGNLTDYYDDKEKVIALSNDIYDSSSVAAVGIAMHEVGHALQYADGYKPIHFRNFMLKACKLSSKFLWPLIIIGLIFSFGVENGGVIGDIFLWAGIGFFGLSAIFNLVTLPVEYNASNRAMQLMKSENILTEQELPMAKEILKSAALTYVAALMVSIMNLVRFLVVALGNRNDN